MSDKTLDKVDNKEAKAKEPEVITINLQPFLMPVSIIFSAIIISVSLFTGLNNIAMKVSGTGSTTTPVADTTTTGTGTTATTAGAVTVTKEQIVALFNKDGVIKFGDSSKKALLVEFSDPSCPYCHIAGGLDPELNQSAGAQFMLTSQGGTYIAPVEEMRKLVDSGQAGFAWVYTNGHGNGEMGTKAMYCGYEKGKFWEVHDLLMNNAGYTLLNTTVQNDKTKSQVVADFLKSAVDPSFMKSCLDSGKYDSKLNEDIAVATSFGVSGTPGFFINQTNFAGAYSWTDMKSAADAALGS